MKVVIIGAGPSLDKNLLDFKMRGGEFMDAVIIATDAALVKCLNMRIVPNYVATLEDYPDYKKFFDNEIARKFSRHYSVFYSYKTSYDIKLLLKTMKVGLILAHLDRQSDVICNVGLFAYLIAAQHLKADKIYLIGMDHCYGENEHPNIKLDTEVARRSFFTTINPHLKKRMIMNPIFMLWREEFLRERMVNKNIRCINMTGWGVLFGRDIEWIPELI